MTQHDFYLDQEPDSLPGNDNHRLVDVSQVAKILDVSERTVWRLRSGRQIPAPIRIGGLVRWRRSDIIAWIEADCRPPNKPR